MIDDQKAAPQQPGTDSSLKKNTAAMFSGLLGRNVLQAGTFILIARALSVDEYGAFVSVVALVNILAPFSTLGMGTILVKQVAREPETFADYWGRTLVMTAIFGGALVLVVSALGPGLLPAGVPATLLGVVACADLIFARLTESAGQAFQAHERLSVTSLLQMAPGVFRLAFAVGMTFTPAETSPLMWGYLYLVASAASALIGLAVVRRKLGPAEFSRPQRNWPYGEGAQFAVGLAGHSVYNDIDKVMVARLGSLNDAGVYASAYRIVEVAIMPVRALMISSYPRFFRQGRDGLGASRKVAEQLLGRSVGYGLFATAGLWATAPLAARVLGDGFAGVEPAIRIISVLPLLRGISYLAGDALTGAGRQGIRTIVLVSGALFNVGLNAVIIPKYGWRGAGIATIVTDGLLGATMWILVVVLHARIRRREGTPK